MAVTAVHHSHLSICGDSPPELQITKSQHIDTWFCTALHIWVWLEPTLGNTLWTWNLKPRRKRKWKQKQGSELGNLTAETAWGQVIRR